MADLHRTKSLEKQFAFFVAPICNQLAAIVMSGLKKLGATVYANRTWCCGPSGTTNAGHPEIPEWNWCHFIPDNELLQIAKRSDVFSIGTVRYESANYWRHDGDGAAVRQAAEIQLEAIKRDLIDLYIDDGDYDLVYRQLDSVPLYVKREPTTSRPVHAMTLGLCPWIPIAFPVQNRDFSLVRVFPTTIGKNGTGLER